MSVLREQPIDFRDELHGGYNVHLKVTLAIGKGDLYLFAVFFGGKLMTRIPLKDTIARSVPMPASKKQRAMNGKKLGSCSGTHPPPLGYDGGMEESKSRRWFQFSLRFLIYWIVTPLAFAFAILMKDEMIAMKILQISIVAILAVWLARKNLRDQQSKGG